MLARIARKNRRQVSVEELSANNWHFPDEDGSVRFEFFVFPYES